LISSFEIDSQQEGARRRVQGWLFLGLGTKCLLAGICQSIFAGTSSICSGKGRCNIFGPLLDMAKRD